MPTINKCLSILFLCGTLFWVNTASAAPIKLKTNGVGDALIYPAFIGYFDNWFAIQNDSELWLQGHLRFRGAAWGAELLSFDVILAPGDVMWFRLADVDGDSLWEIDQSVDPLNFAYTGLQSACNNNTVPDCLEAQHSLTPSPAAQIPEALLNHERDVGYIEFIGECELRGMTTAKMDALLAGDNTGDMFHTNSLASSGTGTNCWAWSDAADGFVQDTNGPNGSYSLGDFPNVVSGTGFIHLPDTALGLAYNAEALVNFRTVQHPHRVDSYRVVNGVDLDAANSEASQRNRSVIVHDDNALAAGGGATPFGHYLYRFENGFDRTTENRLDEVLMSALTAFGPTLADGDDYDLTADVQTINGELRNIYGGENALRPVGITGEFDDWDSFRFHPGASPGSAGDGRVNSIAEVEEAIRVGGRRFSGFYVDMESDENPIQSWYFTLFPTKMFYRENIEMLIQAMSATDYRDDIIVNMVVTAIPIDLAFWDAEGREGTRSPGCNTSGFFCSGTIPVSSALSQTLSVLSIDAFFKKIFPNSVSFQTGRVIIDMNPEGPDDPRNVFFGDLNPTRTLSWPGLMYTFEVESNFTAFGQWRSMQR